MSFLINISKTQIKITDIRIDEVVFNDEAIAKADFKSIEWKWDIDVYRTPAARTDDGKHDVFRVEVVLYHYTSDKQALIATTGVTTFFKTKPLSRNEADSNLWQFLITESYQHCIGVYACEIKNTPILYRLPGVLHEKMMLEDVEYKLDNIWRNEEE
jgi:hypothetical protein